jgi:NADH-quinone oxidoreductase subunit L
MTFFGRFRGGHEAEHHLHESPWSMLGPLVFLAIGSAVVGKLVPVPHIVEPVLRLTSEAEVPAAWLPYVATTVAIAGIVAAYYLYVLLTDLPGRIAASFTPLYRLFDAKYYFDHVYYAFVDTVVVKGSDLLLWRKVDAVAIDGTVNATGRVVDGIAGALRFVQTGLVRSYAFLILWGAVALLGYLLWP